MDGLPAHESRSLLLARRIEEHAIGGPAAHHAALYLLFLGVPDLDPHLATGLGEGRGHLGEGNVLFQSRRPEGRGREADLVLGGPIRIEEGAGRGLASLDLNAHQNVARQAPGLLLDQGALADEIGLLLEANGPADAGLDGRLALT